MTVAVVGTEEGMARSGMLKWVLEGIAVSVWIDWETKCGTSAVNGGMDLAFKQGSVRQYSDGRHLQRLEIRLRDNGRSARHVPQCFFPGAVIANSVHKPPLRLDPRSGNEPLLRSRRAVVLREQQRW